MAPKVFLRVNGIGISRAWVRNRLEDGSPFGKPEVVIDVPATEKLPALGEITVVENDIAGLPGFKIEVKEGKADWKEVSPGELASLLTKK
jgi:hypothetical protein